MHFFFIHFPDIRRISGQILPNEIIIIMFFHCYTRPYEWILSFSGTTFYSILWTYAVQSKPAHTYVMWHIIECIEEASGIWSVNDTLPLCLSAAKWLPVLDIFVTVMPPFNVPQEYQTRLLLCRTWSQNVLSSVKYSQGITSQSSVIHFLSVATWIWHRGRAQQSGNCSSERSHFHISKLLRCDI